MILFDYDAGLIKGDDWLMLFEADIMRSIMKLRMFIFDYWILRIVRLRD
jgi:hypothetical protein